MIFIFKSLIVTYFSLCLYSGLGWVVGFRPIVRMWCLGLRGECPLWESFYRILSCMPRSTSANGDSTCHFPSTSFEGRTAWPLVGLSVVRNKSIRFEKFFKIRFLLDLYALGCPEHNMIIFKKYMCVTEFCRNSI